MQVGLLLISVGILSVGFHAHLGGFFESHQDYSQRVHRDAHSSSPVSFSHQGTLTIDPSLNFRSSLLESVVCAATGDHVAVHDRSCRRRPCGCLWSLLPQETEQMSVVLAASGEEASFAVSLVIDTHN